jgi:hypothetical protein
LSGAEFLDFMQNGAEFLPTLAGPSVAQSADQGELGLFPGRAVLNRQCLSPLRTKLRIRVQ